MATPTLAHGSRSTRSTITWKLLMAASGLVFIGYLIAHMYGNLKVFAGEEAFNEYAHHLRTFGEPMLPHEGLLWVIRLVLIVALVVHVAAAVILTGRAHKARSTKYVMKKNAASSLSSRTMRWGGLAILLFVIWHLLNFTIVKISATGETGAPEGPYAMLVDNFQVWWMTLIYLAALVALGMHLHHGVWSACQTLGLTNTEKSRNRAKDLGVLTAVVIAGGFAIVPLSVLFGLVK